jgi:cysteine synthase A
MREIVSALGRIDYLFCATSACGALRGCAEYIRHNDLNVKIFDVDAKVSAIFQLAERTFQRCN